MAHCQNCGSELTGHYCNICGARAQEEKAAKKAPKPAAPVATRPAAAGRTQGLFSPQRIGKTTAMGLLGVLLFGAGTVFGFWLSGGAGGSSPTATASVEEGSMPAIAYAGKYMDEGVEYLNKGEKTAAVSSFRKAISYYEKALKEDPTDLYAQTYLGLTYFYTGDSTKALQNERAVLDKDPNYLWAIFNLAWMYEASGKPDEALLMYQKYLAVADQEKNNLLKYAEQSELIERQLDASKKAVEAAKGGGK